MYKAAGLSERSSGQRLGGRCGSGRAMLCASGRCGRPDRGPRRWRAVGLFCVGVVYCSGRWGGCHYGRIEIEEEEHGEAFVFWAGVGLTLMAHLGLWRHWVRIGYLESDVIANVTFIT